MNSAIKKSKSLHWLIFGLSLILTVSVWYYAKKQVDEKIKKEFTLKTETFVKLLAKRLETYENYLMTGVAFLEVTDEVVDAKKMANL